MRNLFAAAVLVLAVAPVRAGDYFVRECTYKPLNERGRRLDQWAKARLDQHWWEIWLKKARDEYRQDAMKAAEARVVDGSLSPLDQAATVSAKFAAIESDAKVADTRAKLAASKAAADAAGERVKALDPAMHAAVLRSDVRQGELTFEYGRSESDFASVGLVKDVDFAERGCYDRSYRTDR